MILFLVVEEVEVEGWSTRSPLVSANTLVSTLVAQHNYVLSGFPLSQPWMCKDKVKPALSLPLSPVPEIQLKVFFGGGWVLDSSFSRSWNHKRHSALQVPPVHLQKVGSSGWRRRRRKSQGCSRRSLFGVMLLQWESITDVMGQEE